MEIEELIKKIKDLESDELKKLQEALKLTNDEISELSGNSSTLTEALKLAGDEFTNLSDAAEGAKRIINDMREDQLKMHAINVEVAKSTNDYIAEVEAGAKAFEEFNKIKRDAFTTDEDYEETQKNLEKQLGITKAQAAEYYLTLKTKLSPAFREGEKAGSNFATGLGTSLGLISPKMMLLFKAFQKFDKILKDDKGKEGFKKGMKKIINPTNIALGVLAFITSSTLKYAMAVDKATAAFAKQTGAGRALTEEIMSVGGEFRNLGIDAEGAGKAAGQLFDSFTGFMQESSAGKKELMKTVASLELLGVSGQVAADSLQIMSNNFGLSTKQASKMTKQLSIAGSKIGISSSKMMTGFVEASKSLAVYGKESIKVFTDLAAQAKAAGVEASALLGIAKQFDTFSGAADAAGKLNSILGSQLSATELLTMKENERIETLIRSVQAQGTAFSDMDKYSQMAIANAAGITDMAEAQRIFGMNVNQYRQGLRESEAEEEFNQRLKDAMSVTEKLTKAFQNFMIQFAPVVNFIAVGAQMFLDFSQSMNGVPAIILGIIAAIVVLMKIFPILLGLFSFAPVALGGFMTALPLIGALIAGIALTLALIDTGPIDSITGFFQSISGTSGATVNTTVDNVGGALDLVDTVIDNEATLKNILPEIALISTGATTQSITRATTSTAINQFAANFQNVFKPEVKVMVGTTELDARIDDRIAKNQRAV